VACRELLKGETASTWLILLGLLCGGSEMEQAQSEKK